MMADGQFDPPAKIREERWLGSGLYFFEENFELAQHYALRRSVKSGKPGAVLEVEIDLVPCLDLTRPTWQEVLRTAYCVMKAEGRIGGEKGFKQKPLELHKNVVRAGYRGEWEDYGVNALDYAVIERAVSLSYEQDNIAFQSVRGVFLELGPIYDSSWIYAGAHAAIAVRKPPLGLEVVGVTKVR